MKYSDQEWWYDFRTLPTFFKEDNVRKFNQGLNQQYAVITKSWNDDINSEWICRNYMALKMILSASVMLESLDYAEDHNLRVVESYLEYYSVLNSLRSIVFTSPNLEWRAGELIKLNHGKIINVASDILAKIDKEKALEIKSQLYTMKAFRELISYRAPSNGDTQNKPKLKYNRVELCQLFVEVAQLQSEVLENSISKHVTGSFIFKDEYILQVCDTVIDDECFYDEEDAYRLGYYRRKQPKPANIHHMMTEGHIEDFFGAWIDKEDRKDVFSPDDDWHIIFDVP